MDSLVDILSSSAWQGIQAFLGIIAILISLPWSRQQLVARNEFRWIFNIPWTLLFFLVVVASGMALAINHNFYQGLSLVLAALVLVLLLEWIKLRQTVTDAANSLQFRNSNFEKLARSVYRIVEAQETAFHIENWERKHIVSRTGDDSLHDEFTIVPVSDEPILFHRKQYDIATSVPTIEDSIVVSGENLTEGTPLTVVETMRTKTFVRYIFIIEPPSRFDYPERIAISCSRKGIWHHLIDMHEDSGYIVNNYPCNSLNMEFVAPPGMQWTAIKTTPRLGETSIRSVGNSSVSSWTIQGVESRTYSFDVYAKKQNLVKEIQMYNDFECTFPMRHGPGEVNGPETG